MGHSAVILDSKTASARAILIVVVASALVFAWFAVRWQLGDMLGELTPPNQPDVREVADTAIALAPRDPMPRWLAAAKEKENFSPAGLENSVRMFETVVRLSPYDYRWWIELGRAYEQAERTDRAESAFKHAVDLAPAYTFPHWQFGNFYLRQNRTEEAFTELRKTTEKSVSYREQVFSLAWDYFDKDPQKLEMVAASGPDVRATLASFYAVRGRAEDALRVWDTLTEEQKAPHEAIARNIAQGLHDRKFYRQALEFARQTGIDPDARLESFTNGGFEEFMRPSEETLFGWRINRAEGRADVMPDSTVKTEGARSLRITFKGYTKPDLYNVVQFVAVQPAMKYRLSFMLRTDNLKSGGPPLLKVTAGPENTIIAATGPFTTGSSDWKKIELEFSIPENADGISIITSRALWAGECPITGSIWYDDFRLTRL